MRQDQYEKLQALEEKLLDVFVVEADPAEWPGDGLRMAAMDAQTRGDRYWVKKNAAATAMLVGKVVGLIGQTQITGAGTTPAAEGDGEGDKQLDAEIAAAEKEAAKLIRQMQSGSQAKAKYDRKVHGRS